MHHSEQHLQVRTLTDTLALLHPGDRCVICMPTSDVAVFSASFLGNPKSDVLIVTPFPAPPDKSARSVPTILSLERSISPNGAVNLLKQRLKRLPKRTAIVMDATRHDRSWLKSEKERARFFDEATRIISKNKFRSMFVISRGAFSAPKITQIKDEATFFLDVARVGSMFCGQFLTAKGVYADEFFLPRIVSWEKGTFELRNAVIPFGGSSSNDLPAQATGQVIHDLLEQKYRRIFESARDGIGLFELRGSHRELNKRACEMLGYRADDLSRLKLSDVVPPLRYRHALRNLVQLLQKGNASFDLQMLKKSGKAVTIRVSASTYKQGLYVAILRDITDSAGVLSEVQASAEEYKGLVDSAPFPVAVFVSKRLVLRNKAFISLFTWMGEEELSISHVFGKGNQAFVKSLAALNDNTATTHEGIHGDITIATPAGEELTLRVSASAATLRGKTGIECCFVNVTEQQHLTRQLEDSRNTYERLFQHSPDPITVIKDSRIEFVNGAFLQFAGYNSQEDVVGKDVAFVFGNRVKQRLFEPEAFKTLREGEVRVGEFDLQRNDGKRIRLEAKLVAIPHGTGRACVAYYSDITDRKRIHADLTNTVKALELLKSVLGNLAESTSPNALAESALESAMKGTGFEGGAVYIPEIGGSDFVMVASQGLSAKMVQVLNHQSSQEGLLGFVSKTQEALLLPAADYPAHLPHRALFQSEDIHTVSVVPFVAHGAARGMLLLATKKKEVEPHHRLFLISIGEVIGQAMERVSAFSRLQEAESHYRTAIELIPIVVYRASAAGALTYVSPQMETLLGYKPTAFYESPDLWRTTLHPDDRPKYGQRISNQEQPGSGFSLEYRMLPKGKAAYRWVRDTIIYSRDEEGNVLTMTGMLQDISESVEASASLSHSQGDRQRLIESMKDGVAIFDAGLRYIDCNKAMEMFTGIPHDRMVGSMALESTPDLMTPEVRQLLARALEGEAVSTENLSYVLPDKSGSGYIWARFTPLRDESDKISGILGLFADVTNRKVLELEVRESEETLRNVIDAMGDALMISDLQGRVWEVNREFSRLTGQSRSETLGMHFPYPWVLDEETAKFVQWIAALREQSELRDFDMTWQAKGGRRFPVSLNTTLLRNGLGEPVAMLNIARDISDRKRLSNELERKSRQIELVNRIISKANATVEFKEVFETISAEVVNLIPHVDQVNVGLLTDDGSAMVLFACASPTGKMLPIGKEIPLEQTVSKIAIQQKRATILNDLLHEEGLKPDTGSIVEGLRSQISIPISLNEKTLGTFNVASVRENAFAGDELSFLQPIADQIGAIVDRVRLFQEVKAQVRRVTALYELGRSLTGAVDTQSVLSIVYAEATKSIPMDGLFYHGVSETGGLVSLYHKDIHSSSPYGKRGEDTMLHLSQGLTQALAKGEPMIFGSDATAAAGISAMAVPMKSKSRIVGILSIIRHEPGVYDKNHMRILESIASLTEIAMDRAALYEETVHKSVQIENRNKELDDFTYVVSHDLKEPLISIEGYSKILLQDYKDKLDDEGREYLNTAVQAASRMKYLIDDLLTLSRVGRVTETQDVVSSKEIIDGVLAELQYTLREKHCDVHVSPGMPSVRYNATQLGMVFRNLVSNALKFNDKPVPRIIIGMREEAGNHVFFVSDNGIGIDKRYFDKVFVIFQRLQRSEEYRGTGAGLTIVKKIVENHRGRIWIESEVGNGATFLFTIPK